MQKFETKCPHCRQQFMANKCRRCDCFPEQIFILSEFTDISFEVKAVLCFDFYAFGDVFRGNGIVQQNRIAGNRVELEGTILKN